MPRVPSRLSVHILRIQMLPETQRRGKAPKTHRYGKMAFHMKTTIELPDDLFIAAKKRAAETRTTLREIFERGLRRELGEAPQGPPARRRIRWVTTKGGVPPGMDLADRTKMHEWLRRPV